MWVTGRATYVIPSSTRTMIIVTVTVTELHSSTISQRNHACSVIGLSEKMGFQLRVRSELSATVVRWAGVRWKRVPDDRSRDRETSLADGRVCPRKKRVTAVSRTEWPTWQSETGRMTLIHTNSQTWSRIRHCLMCEICGDGIAKSNRAPWKPVRTQSTRHHSLEHSAFDHWVFISCEASERSSQMGRWLTASHYALQPLRG